MLRITDLSVSYGDHVAVTGLSLDAPDGRVLCVLGPSGSGKSTVLRAVAGLEPPRAGTIELDGTRLDGLRPDQRDVGLMFQEHALFPHRSVDENVAFGPRMRGLGRATVRRRVEEALALVDMSATARRPVTELSGGERQRVALARSIAPRPKLLMLDEPLGSLDRTLQTRLLEDLPHVFRELGTTVVYVTHDQHEALALADRVAVMRDGRLEQVDEPAALWRAPRTTFVADFLGLTYLTALPVRAGVASGPWGPLPVPGTPDGERDVVLLPGAVRATDPQRPRRPGELAVPAYVADRRFAGDHVRLVATPDAGPRLSVAVRSEVVPAPGDRCELALDPRAVRVLEDDGAADGPLALTLTSPSRPSSSEHPAQEPS